jgi:hypothetical protein
VGRDSGAPALSIADTATDRAKCVLPYMATYMDKTTLYLDASDYRKLKRLAAASRRTPAALVREAVAEYVARHDTPRQPRSIGAFSSGRRDLSERAEALLGRFGERPASRRAGR